MKKRTQLHDEAVAYHEAGHAVIAWHEGIGLRSASIIPVGTTGGRIIHYPMFQTINPEVDTGRRSRDRVEKSVRISLAGSIAQRKFNSRTYRRFHDEEDLQYAVDLLARIVGSDEALNAYFKLLYIQTRDILNNPDTWAAVESVAAALLHYRVLRGPEIKTAIQQSWDARKFNETDVSTRRQMVGGRFGWQLPVLADLHLENMSDQEVASITLKIRDGTAVLA